MMVIGDVGVRLSSSVCCPVLRARGTRKDAATAMARDDRLRQPEEGGAF
jgi:hypothetical protein